jgi:hypothetical protein
MQQSPSGEANQFQASQEIPGNLWNPKVYYHIQKCSPPAPRYTLEYFPLHFLAQRYVSQF